MIFAREKIITDYIYDTDVQTQFNGQIAAQKKIKSCPP
jgi:hypothetical protein